MTLVLEREALECAGDGLEREQPATFNDVKRALVALGIEPYAAREVRRYQAMLARHYTPLRSHVYDWYRRIITLLAVGGFVTLVVSSLSYSALSSLTTGPAWLQAVVAWSLTVTSVALMVVGVAAGTLDGRKITYARWVSIPLHEYRGQMPEFVGQTATELQERCPTAQLQVEELRLVEETLDPFLVVVDAAGQKHYLEVWNERDFVRRW